MSFLETSFYHNTILNWIVALGVVIVIYVVVRSLKWFVVRRLASLVEKTASEVDDILMDVFKRTNSLVVFIISLYFGSLFLTLPDKAAAIIKIIVTMAFFFQVALWGNRLIDNLLTRAHKLKREKDPAAVTAFGALSFFARVILWSLIVFLILDNFGVDITTLVAGLGVGGIAIALAVQNILGDVFHSVSILLDKPFEVGDFIIVDDKMGVVEKIGIKTTRVRSLSGEQLIFSNTDLVSSRIRNYKRMNERRVVFTFGVIYQTPVEKLEAIPKAVKQIIESIDQARFDRAHFSKYGDSSLDFECVYYVLDRDYNLYMDIQQQINLAIFRHFAKEGIEFAYPTQTLFINK
ncbi:MAG: mechanosensitive ion channel family protein [Candidatus Zixiibacteriota bacterium]